MAKQAGPTKKKKKKGAKRSPAGSCKAVKKSKSSESAGSVQAQRPMPYGWIYQKTFQVQVGKKMTAFDRESCAKLRALAHSKTGRKVLANSHLFYNAQLLHYGLPPAANVDEAIKTFREAFAELADANDTLEIPAHLKNIEVALKKEYEERLKSVQRKEIAQLQERLNEAKQQQDALKRRLENLEGLVSGIPPEVNVSKPEAVESEQNPRTAQPPSVREGSEADDDTEDETITPTSANKTRGKKRKLTVKAEQKPAKKVKSASKDENASVGNTPSNKAQAITRKFSGSWLVCKSDGARFEGRECKIFIGKRCLSARRQYNYDQRAVKGIQAYAGHFKIGELDAWIRAGNSAETSQMIGDCLKTTFEWRTKCTKKNQVVQSGTLEVFFNGNKIDGYLSGPSLKGQLAFETYERSISLLDKHEAGKVVEGWLGGFAGA